MPAARRARRRHSRYRVSARLFSAMVSYGADRGFNPYAYPPLVPNRDGVTPLGARMNYPDIGRPEVQAVWARQYAHLIDDLGIDMIWQDMMCPAPPVSADTPDGTLPLDLMTHDGATPVPHGVCHNAYAMYLLKATHAALRSLRPETRPFILARGGYAGLQRYAALWTGDNASSWDFLRITIPQVLNLGLSGVPISGSDVGGFATGPIPDGTTAPSVVRDGRVIGGLTDPELFVRWMQAGSFLPWFRNHYIGYDKEYQEVYAFGEAVAGICRAAIERRYRMLQVYYDAMYEWTQTGMPIVRALFLNDPDDPAVYRHLDDQFFVGKDMLVAPILAPAPAAGGPAVRDVYLPAGSDWFVFAEGASRWARRCRAVRHCRVSKWRSTRCRCSCAPVRSCRCARAPSSTSANWRRTRSRFCVYPGPGRRASALPGRRHQHPRRAGQRLPHDAAQPHAPCPAGRACAVQRLHDGYTPAEAFFFIRWLGMAPPSAVSVDGPRRGRRFVACGSRRGARRRLRLGRGRAEVIVKVFDRAPDVTMVVQFASVGTGCAAEVSAMIERLWLGKPAEISFTCDFHELVAGDLRPGAALLLRYDPHRIVPAGRALSLRRSRAAGHRPPAFPPAHLAARPRRCTRRPASSPARTSTRPARARCCRRRSACRPTPSS